MTTMPRGRQFAALLALVVAFPLAFAIFHLMHSAHAATPAPYQLGERASASASGLTSRGVFSAARTDSMARSRSR